MMMVVGAMAMAMAIAVAGDNRGHDLVRWDDVRHDAHGIEMMDRRQPPDPQQPEPRTRSSG